MRLLLDTHALLWLLGGDERLGEQARDAITDPANDVFVSIVSFWEIAVKIRIGKLQADLKQIIKAADASGLQVLALQPDHLIELMSLPLHPDHRDPFDHQLIAQALAESLVFVSEDRHAPRYPAKLMTCSDSPAAPPTVP